LADPQLGVVTIGLNEGERLKRCLSSLPADARVVYVDSGSSDGSVQLALLAGAAVVKLDLARPFTAARARNEGLARLIGEAPETQYVQFLDGDCELEEAWLSPAVAFLEKNPSVAVACGRRRERLRAASLYNAWMDEEWDTPIGPAASCGGDALMRVSAICEAGGYDDGIIAGEEPELCARLRELGWAIHRLDLPMSVHDANMHRFRQWWLRAVRSGYGYAQVWCKTASCRTGRLYSRELLRAFGWTLGVSALALGFALVAGGEWMLFGAGLWGIQFLRLARRDGVRKAAHLMLGKWAEIFGVSRFAAAALLRRERRAILYK